MKFVLEKIKQYRVFKGYTQVDIADKLNITSQNYQLIESGKISVTLDRVEKIAEILGIDVLDLFGLNEKQSSQTEKENENLKKQLIEANQNIKELSESLKDRRLRLGKIYYHLKIFEKFLEKKGLSEQEFGQALDAFIEGIGEDLHKVRKKYKYAYKLNALEFLEVVLENFDTNDFKEFD